MRLREILPITEWLGSYSLARLGPDGVAGLSLAAFVIPNRRSVGGGKHRPSNLSAKGFAINQTAIPAVGMV